ncbi:MAG TPA: hypothetical protein VGX76_08000 [Pirellulales bacterium]|jgi:hypothetical protein|nr:hypothetical protein [Pirellulales bacterium]
MSALFLVDDKHVPLYRVVWVSATPHFCGAEDCEREGYYEVRLEQGEVVWANHQERDGLLAALEEWVGGTAAEDDEADWE